MRESLSWRYIGCGLDVLSVEELDSIGKRFDYRRNMYGGNVVDISGLIRILQNCEVFVVSSSDEIVGFVYFEPIPKSSDALFHFSVLSSEDVGNYHYDKILREILYIGLDKCSGLGYDRIYGRSPYRSVMRLGRRFGFEIIEVNPNAIYDGYDDELKDEYVCVLTRESFNRSKGE